MTSGMKDRAVSEAISTDNWEQFSRAHNVRWQSQNGWQPPQRLLVVRQTIAATRALRLLQQGISLVWQGDFPEGRQLLQSIKRRLPAPPEIRPDEPMPQGFHRIRLARAQQARLLGSILIRIDPGWVLRNTRAVPIEQACAAASGNPDQPLLMPLTELLGMLSAFQWQLKGVPVAALDASIHPRHGVFAPTRQEYLELVMRAALPAPCEIAIDLGTGTGVIAAILARRSVPSVIAIDSNPAAIMCARDNIERLGLNKHVQVVQQDLLEGSPAVDLVVCNPPWLPGKVRSPLETAIYDPDHQMLRGFLQQVPGHLRPAGQAWLIMSDLAEHLGLRTPEQLPQWIEQAGLKVLDKISTRPSHPKVQQGSDPLARWRKREITSLWQLSLA